MSCLKCRNEVHDHHTMLCKQHFYHRKQEYTYLGHKVVDVNNIVNRRCLMCDKPFVSTGNRRCETCNKTSDCHYDNDVTFYVKV